MSKDVNVIIEYEDDKERAAEALLSLISTDSRQDRDKAIVALNLSGSLSQVELAQRFGLSQARIWQILNASPEYQARAQQLQDADHTPN